MKILLTYLRYEGDVYMDSYEQDHLGMGYLASVLREEGHDVRILNAHWQGLALEEVVEQVRGMEFDLVGVPLHVETLYDLNRYTEWLDRNRDVPIVIGGHWASMEPEKLFALLPRVQYIAMGEGEYTIRELAAVLEQGGDLSKVSGLAWRDRGRTVVNPPRPLIKNLDELPMPARDDLEVYLRPEWSFKKRTANMLASRGCHAFCSFCSIVAMYAKSPGLAVRARSPVNVVDEIEWLMRNYRVNQIFFGDDNFRAPDKSHPGWSEAVAREIIARGLDIKFIFMCRVDEVEEEVFALFKQAGLVGVAMGIETDVDRMLDSYNKRTSKESNRNALRILRNLRIDPLISFIMFDPYTTLQEIRENLAFFREIDYIRYCHYTRPVTLMAGYDLKTYGGTNYTAVVGADEATRDGEYSYECDYKDSQTSEVFNMLQRWRVVILQLVMHNPLWMIDMAHRLGRKDLVYRIHSLARKYTKQDMRLFEEIVELVAEGHSATDSACVELLHRNTQEALETKRRLAEIEDRLKSEHLEKTKFKFAEAGSSV